MFKGSNNLCNRRGCPRTRLISVRSSIGSGCGAGGNGGGSAIRKQVGDNDEIPGMQVVKLLVSRSCVLASNPAPSTVDWIVKVNLMMYGDPKIEGNIEFRALNKFPALRTFKTLKRPPRRNRGECINSHVRGECIILYVQNSRHDPCNWNLKQVYPRCVRVTFIHRSSTLRQLQARAKLLSNYKMFAPFVEITSTRYSNGNSYKLDS